MSAVVPTMNARRADVSTMKAIVCAQPGRLEALQLVEVPTPAVADDGLLVRVRACSINPFDFFTLSRVSSLARFLGGGFKAKPVVVGTDFAGIVESVGKNVEHFKPGDAVFGATKGAFAEYVAIPEREVACKPANATFEQAAATPVAGVTALQALRDQGRLKSGQRVLVNGGSGGVGSFALQIAKHLGGIVTAVCSPNNLDTARTIGADRVIDYTREDFTRSGEYYDVLIDIAGSHRWSEYTRVLTPTGILVPAGASANTVWGSGRTLRHLASIRLRSLFASRKAAFFIAKMNRADLDVLRDLIESGRLTPVIDRRYELGHVAEAMAYMGDGHARGKIVVNVA